MVSGGREARVQAMESPVAITREHVLQALSTVAVDAAGTSLVASGRLSEVVVDQGGRVMFSIAITPAEAAAMEPVRQAAAGRPPTPLCPGVITPGWPLVSGRRANLGAELVE